MANIQIREVSAQFRRKIDSKQNVLASYTALMGKGDGTNPSIPGREGYVWVRVGHIQSLMMAYNARIMPADDKPIYVGYLSEQPSLLQVISTRQTAYAESGQGVMADIPAHHINHEYDGGDDVYVDWRRILGFRVGRPTAFTVTVDSGVMMRGGLRYVIAEQTLNLAALQPVAGTDACYILIKLDVNGVATAVAGANQLSINVLRLEHCPVEAAGEMALAAVRLYVSQTEIGDTPTNPDIIDLRFPQAQTAGPTLPASHDILSAYHGDTLAAAVVDGDVVIGNVTPAWSRLAISVPAAGTLNYLGVNNAELRPSWKSASSAPGAAAAILQSNLTGGLTLAGLLSYYQADWTGGNTIYVPLAGDIQTYINAATEGDTLVLASGEYVITSSITVGKQLNIVGQGNAGFYTIPYAPAHGTVISSATAAVVGFQIDDDNVRIADLSINLTGNASTGINTAKDLTGLVLHNIDVIVTCAGLAQGFTVWSSNVVMRNLSFYITSTNTAASGLWFWNNNTSTINAVADCYNVTGTVVGAGTYVYGFVCENINDANTLTLNLESCAVRALTGTPLDVAVASISTTTNNSIVNCYLCTLDGADYDAYQTGANELNLGGSVLVNNLVSGTVTYRATMAAGTVVVGGTMTVATGSITDTTGSISFGNETLAFNNIVYTWPAADAHGYLHSDGAGALTWDAGGGGAAWLLVGNAGTNPAVNFLGTTDAQPIIFKTNSLEAGYIGVSTAIAGNARGAGAIEFMAARDVATQVASGASAAIVGGEKNTASGDHSASVGGNSNVISGNSAANVGGDGNTASGAGAVCMAGKQNTADGTYSVAMGTRANTNGKDGSFVFADNNALFDFTASVANEFAVRARGGVRFVTATDLINVTTYQATIDTTAIITAKKIGAAGIALDPNAATGDFALSLSPANLTANRRVTFPDADGTAALLEVPNIFTANQTISNAAPSLALTDTTGAAKSLTIAVDANVADLRESAGASGSLLAFDLANNRIGCGTAAPEYALHSSAADDANPVCLFERIVTATNTLNVSQLLRVTSTGNMADGFGPMLALEIKDDAGVANRIGAIAAIRAGADNSGTLILNSYTAGTRVPAVYIFPTGNVKVAGTAVRATTEGTNHIDIFNGTAPAGTLTNGISIYSSAGEGYIMDAGGVATLQTPHNKQGEWIFLSKNTKTGKVLRIDMERMIRALNEQFGWDFIQEYVESM